MRARLAVCLALAACGDDIRIHPPAAKLLEFSPCTSAFECAALTVPADWSDPTGRTISFQVMRAPARIPSQRIGAITFNFGGPGGSTENPIARTYPDQPIASSVALADYFDFVLIDWRGVATTTPLLRCYDATLSQRLSRQRFAPATDADWDALFQLTTDLAAGCQANPDDAPLLEHQDSESAARDLDALRAGLGEDQLNLWMVSYGTRLGAMYATLFPDRVRAVVLDSPMAPVPELERFLMDQSVAFDSEISRFFAWCASTTDARCPFRTADGLAASVATRYEQLLASSNASPQTVGNIALDGPTINLTTTTMMYTPAYSWPALGDALARLAAGDGSFMADLFSQNQLGFVGNDNGFSTYQNVCAQDMPTPADVGTPASYRAFATNVGAAAPHVGLQNSSAQAFAIAWPTTPPQIHAIGPTTAPPLLITATRHDPATPYPWAGELQQALGNGSYLVTYEGDGHGNGSIEPCLGDLSAQFLIDPTTPPAQTDCADDPPTVRIARPAFRRSARAW